MTPIAIFLATLFFLDLAQAGDLLEYTHWRGLLEHDANDDGDVVHTLRIASHASWIHARPRGLDNALQ